MSIEKFSGSFTKEDNGCSIVINETIQGIKDPAALGIYCYLITKPPTWEPNIKELMTHFDMSKDKTYRLIDHLMEINLLHRSQKNENGRFSTYTYTLFLKPRPDFQETVPRPDFPDPEKPDTYKTKKLPQSKDIKNTIVDSSNTTINYLDDKRFMAFYSIYPRKEKPRDAWKAFKTLKLPDSELRKIIEDVHKRKKEHATWQNGKKYISIPASYLRSGEYEGEILREETKETETYDYGYKTVIGPDGEAYLERSAKNG